jgi:hypothetical protein
LAYGAVVFILLYATGIALVAYDEVCDRNAAGPFFTVRDLSAVLAMYAVIAMPTLFARSNLVIKANAVLSLVTLVWAISLIYTARTPPYECVTMGGDYEDHTSGLMEFTFYCLFLVVVSYVLVVIDLLYWALQRLARAIRH